MYDDLDFDQEQHDHREAVQSRLTKIHQGVVFLMQKIYEVFKNDSHEVCIFTFRIFFYGL